MPTSSIRRSDPPDCRRRSPTPPSRSGWRSPTGASPGFAKVGANAFLDHGEASDAELYQLYVLARWHGSGVAATLMEWTLAEARRRGAEALLLSVYVDNHRARRFYARYGFVDVGRFDFPVGATIDEDRVMRLEL